MPIYDHEPMWAGAHYDPGPAGGEVPRLALFGTPDRSGPVLAEAGPATRLREGVYRFNLDDLPPGRYYGIVTFTPTASAEPVKDRTVQLDAPLGTSLAAAWPHILDTLRGTGRRP
jgi:hypothetical protein